MNPRRRIWKFALLASAMVACFAVISCSSVEKYRVLSFFFDGVPPPPGVEPKPMRERGSLQGETSAFLEGIRQLREEPKEERGPILLSVHKPVAEGNCQECHDYEGDVADVPTDAKLCDKCHLEQRQEEGWDHGPINLGTCIPCHVPHRSAHEHLLSKPTPDLCLNCHTGVEPTDGEYHEVPNFENCDECHDPHRMY